MKFFEPCKNGIIKFNDTSVENATEYDNGETVKTLNAINTANHDTVENSSDNLTNFDRTNNVDSNFKRCRICSYEATLTKKKNSRIVLSCHVCNELVHFHCSKLPIYILYTLSTTSKRYVCEICADPPENFLQNIIMDNIVGLGTNGNDFLPTNAHTPDVAATDTNHGRLTMLEEKIDKLSEIIEKYNIPRVADSVQNAHNSFNILNNNCKEFNGRLNKAIEVFQQGTKGSADCPNHDKINEKLDEKEK